MVPVGEGLVPVGEVGFKIRSGMKGTLYDKVSAIGRVEIDKLEHSELMAMRPCLNPKCFDY